jgi:hypothetical protein
MLVTHDRSSSPRTATLPAAGTGGVPRIGTQRPPRRRLRRRVVPDGWWVDVLLAASFGAVTVALVTGHLLGIDTATVRWNDSHRTATTWWIGYGLSCLGQGGPLTYGTAVVAAVLAWRHKRPQPLLVPAAAFALTYLIVGPIKLWSQRAAPHKGSVQMFAHPTVVNGSGMAYPSGHVANAIVWWGALVLLVGPYLPVALGWLVRVGMPSLVAISMVYIDYHWLTDVVAAVPLGLVLSRTLHRVDWQQVPLRPAWARVAATATRTWRAVHAVRRRRMRAVTAALFTWPSLTPDSDE